MESGGTNAGRTLRPKNYIKISIFASMRPSDTNWESSPEKRIIREIFLTKEGGLAPGTSSTAYGNVYETVLIRELQRLTQQYTSSDIRFARGFVVEDYGTQTSGGIAANGMPKIGADGPRFDIICYGGNVAWTTHNGVPHAVVPQSFVLGVIEAKRTLSPGYFPEDSSRAMNEQFTRQKRYLERFNSNIPLIIVGAHYSGSPTENRRKAKADHVALLGDLSESGSADRMAEEGELNQVVELLASQIE